ARALGLTSIWLPVVLGAVRRLAMRLFFFSSRRRHTRLVSDWSSDVCSSDLSIPACGNRRPHDRASPRGARDRGAGGVRSFRSWEIGRASCRESVDPCGRDLMKRNIQEADRDEGVSEGQLDGWVTMVTELRR